MKVNRKRRVIAVCIVVAICLLIPMTVLAGEDAAEVTAAPAEEVTAVTAEAE